MSAAPPKCPICGKPVVSATPGERPTFAPFCSARCRDVDLGRWFDGKYQIPTEERPDEPTDDDP